jgi:hypothetical protein
MSKTLPETFSETLSESSPGTAVVCAACGRAPEADEPTLSWSMSVERGRERMVCPACVRDHLRSIEGKLEPDFF